MPSGSDSVVLSGLEWDTEYTVYVVAENQKGKSQPASMSFRTTAEPVGIPGTLPPAPHTKTNRWGNSKLKSKRHALFLPLTLKGEWQLNKSTGEKSDFLDCVVPGMIFRLNFLSFKFWQPLLNELEFALAELGRALSTNGWRDFLLMFVALIFGLYSAKVDITLWKGP